jgi:transposase
LSETAFVEIDVSSQTLEVPVSTPAANWQASNDAPGIEQLVQQLLQLGPTLIVLKATGGYEFEAACGPLVVPWP